ncbi:peptidase M24 [Synergistales bacterium]|nr:peptidase M24 [Synergistales bacterium]GHV52288.1 peptidase M24 [Synergistales bacterium]
MIFQTGARGGQPRGFREASGIKSGIYSERLKSIQSLLRSSGKLGKNTPDAWILICRDGVGWEDIYYLTGFIGTSGVLLITKDEVTLFTDPRYIEAAEATCRCPVVSSAETRRLSPLNAAAERLVKIRPSRVGCCGNSMSHSAYTYIERAIPSIPLTDISSAIIDMRRHKNGDETKAIKNAARIAGDAFTRSLSDAAEGMSEREFAARFSYYSGTMGGDIGFPAPLLVSSGVRTSLPHALPTDKKFERGDLVMADFAVRSGGYVCDITRMFSIGEPSSYTREHYAILLWAQAEAAALLSPGAKVAAIDASVRDVLRGAELESFFTHGTGHGIGLSVHEAPSIVSGSEAMLREGDVVTIEPGFYKRGEYGMRIEDDYLIRRNGTVKLSENLSSELLAV